MAKKDLFIVLFLLLVSIPLRFFNLGYSEFQDDEKKAFYRPLPNQNVFQFFYAQKKGPMQFAISRVPYIFTNDYRNELAERFPFALASLLSVLVLYFLLYKLTESRIASIFGTLLYSFNGFIVAFSRIVQYQDLNLLFSFLSLLFYFDLTINNRHLFRSSLLGTLFFSLSLLSHWDAVFYAIPSLYFLTLFFLRKDISREYKIKASIYSGAVVAVFLFPFLFMYASSFLSNQNKVMYAQRRLGFSDYDFVKHLFIFKLYNPFITFPLLTTLVVSSVLFIRKNYIYFIWFIVNLLLIRFLMVKPGTHIYNYIVPIFFIISISVGEAAKHLGKFSIAVVFVVLQLILMPLFYQSFIIFVDHNSNYPWNAKTIFGHTTQPYIMKEVLTFGFPHFSGWKEINNFIEKKNNSCTYITNEGKEISQIYINMRYGKIKGKCYFVIKVSNPFISTRRTIDFPEAYYKPSIFFVKVDNKTLAKIYLVSK